MYGRTLAGGELGASGTQESAVGSADHEEACGVESRRDQLGLGGDVCYYIIHLECLMGFTMHFYIIFGTNLLTQSPVPVPVFSLVSVFRRKGISNGVETE